MQLILKKDPERTEKRRFKIYSEEKLEKKKLAQKIWSDSNLSSKTKNPKRILEKPFFVKTKFFRQRP